MSAALKSSGILSLLSIFQRTTGLITFLVLVRLLAPEDFGIISLALFLIYLIDILAASGIQQYIAQKKNISYEDINSAWTLDLLLKSATFIIISLLSYPVSVLNNKPDLALVIVLLSSSVLIRSVANPGAHKERKELNYRNIAKLDIIRKISAMVITISSAFLFQNYWAIVIGDLTSSFIYVILSYRLIKYRPKLSKKNIHQQWLFTKWLIPRGVLGYLRSEVDILIVSAKFGLVSLGGYRIVKEITTMPATDLARPIVEPVIASLSRSIEHNNYDEARETFYNYIIAITIIAAPVFLYIQQYPLGIIGILFGQEWLIYADALSNLAVLLLAFSINPILSNTIIAYKKIKLLFFFDLLTLILVAAPLSLLFFEDLNHFTLLRSALAVIATLILIIITCRTCCISLIKTLFFISCTLLISYLTLFIFPDEVFLAYGTIIHAGLYFMASTILNILMLVLTKKDLVDYLINCLKRKQ